MKSIEIIVHCWAEKIPDFAKLLTAQLSSLSRWPCLHDVYVTVCTAESDHLTKQVCENFQELWESDTDEPVLTVVEFAKHELFRRAAGRNYVAKATLSDIVWFADCDYLFGEGCLDALAAADFTGLAYPGQILVHRSHQLGDLELSRITPGEVFEADLSLFEIQKFKFAIGGLQIVDGDSARCRGYLDGTKWVQPVPSATDFLDTREDKIFRGVYGKSTRLELPELYRMRHSRSAFESAEKRLQQTAAK